MMEECLRNGFSQWTTTIFCLLLLSNQLNAYVISGLKSPESDVGFVNNNSLSSCLNGRLLPDLSCQCSPCWQGPSCSQYVDDYAPRFLIHKATVVVAINATGPVYRAWSSDEDLGLTCPLGPGESTRCPCASVRYQLFSPPGDHRFVLHPDTGVLSRAPEDRPDNLVAGVTYEYKLMVQSVPTEFVDGQDLLYDILDLEIFAASSLVEKIPWT